MALPLAATTLILWPGQVAMGSLGSWAMGSLGSWAMGKVPIKKIPWCWPGACWPSWDLILVDAATGEWVVAAATGQLRTGEIGHLRASMPQKRAVCV